MNGSSKFIFINNNTYKQETLPDPAPLQGQIQKSVSDRFRQLIGRYYWNFDGQLKYTQGKFFPFVFEIEDENTVEFSDIPPFSIKPSKIRLVSNRDKFGPWPGCVNIWYNYFFGQNRGTPKREFDKVQLIDNNSYDTIKIQNLQSFIDRIDQGTGVKSSESGLYDNIEEMIFANADEIINKIAINNFSITSKIGIQIGTLSKLQKFCLLISACAKLGTVSTERINEIFTSNPDENKYLDEFTKILHKDIDYIFGEGQYTTGQINIFEDSYFDVVSPLTNYELGFDLGNLLSTKKAEVLFEYNYDVPEYDGFVGAANINEDRLFNGYTVSKRQDLVPIIAKLRSNLECFKIDLAALLLESPVSTLYVEGHNLKALNKPYPYKEIFPYYASINFAKDKPGVYSSLIQEQSYSGLLLRHLKEVVPSDRTQLFTILRETNLEYLSLLLEENDNKKVNSWDFSEWFWRLTERLAILSGTGTANKSVSLELLPDSFVFGPNNLDVKSTEGTSDYIRDAEKLRLQIIYNKVVDLLIKNNRTYKQIIEGVKPHSEILAYKIAKYDNQDFDLNMGDLKQDTIFDKLPELGTSIQDFWFFNSTLENVVKYVDTQVKNNKQYTYVVYAYPIVIESRYFYFGPTSSTVGLLQRPVPSGQTITPPQQGEPKCEASLYVATTPEAKIYEVPYFISSGRINDDLPASPDIQFVPYKGIDSKILVNLNTLEGDYKTQFVTILDSDIAYYNKLKSSRNLDKNELLSFSNDSNVYAYEAFRLDYHPFDFSDFRQAYYRIFKLAPENIEGIVKFRRGEESQNIQFKAPGKPFSNSFSFDEGLTPNKKYYYIFRTVDVNKNISNPSLIYEVEMVNADGAVFPLIKAVDFRQKNKKETSKNGRRVLLLSPTILQSIPNIDTSKPSAVDVLDDTKLGFKDESIWNKTYKLRITSTKTGKQIDINFVPKIVPVKQSEGC